jgi:hypothetical protein
MNGKLRSPVSSIAAPELHVAALDPAKHSVAVKLRPVQGDAGDGDALMFYRQNY